MFKFIFFFSSCRSRVCEICHNLLQNVLDILLLQQVSGLQDMHTSPADVTMSSYKDLKMKAESISSPIATESFDERYDTRKPCSDSKTCSVMQFSMDDLRRKTQFKFRELPQWKTLHGRIRKTR